MSRLSPRDRELVAIGAAMGSNCVPCIEYHVPQARKAGLSDVEIAEAVRLSDKVRQVPARKVLDVALRLVGVMPAADIVGAHAAASVTETIGTPLATSGEVDQAQSANIP